MEIEAGFQKTEVGIIPSDWEVKKLSEIGESIIGLTYSPSNVKPYGTLVLRSSNVQNGKLAFEDNVFVDMELPKRVIVQENDILICVRNGSRQLIGKCALIDKKTAGSAFGAFMSIYRSQFSNFVFHQFQSHIIQRQINETLGATINQITNKDLASFQVPLPPTKAEQTAIATALNDADALISSLEKLIAKKRNIKQGAMQELLKPKEGWEAKTFEEIADKKIEWSITGGPFGSNLKSSDYTKDGIRIIQLQNIGDGKFINEYEIFTSQKKADELLSCNIYPNEIILSKMGDPVARACIIPDFHTRYLMCSDGIRLVVDNKLYDSYFIYVYINFSKFRIQAENASTGTTRKRIGLKELKTLKIICPNKSEQTRITNILSDMDAEIEAIEKKLEKYKMLKQGMMQNLLTGKIRLI